MQFKFKDPAHKRLGYWLAGGGVVLTLAIGILSFGYPSIRRSPYWSIPPCLILAGLALEAGEVVMSRRGKGGSGDDL
jgi:hypothetical protein